MKFFAVLVSLLFLSQTTFAFSLSISSILGIESPEQNVEMPKEMQEELQKKTKTSYRSIVENLPENYSERKNVTVAYANEVCDLPGYEKFEGGIEKSDEAQIFVRQLQNAMSITNRYLSTSIHADDLSRVYGGTKKVAKYTSSLDSYKTWRDRGCSVAKNPTNQSMKKFYRSTAVLTFEVALIQIAPSYKIASKSTRLFNNGAGIARVRKYCGDECYSTALSVPHWGVRYSSDGYIDYILDVSNEEGIKISRADLKALAKDVGDQLPERGRIEETGNQITGMATNFTQKHENDVPTNEDIQKGSTDILELIMSFLIEL